MKPNDYEIGVYKKIVRINVGYNTLEIEGAGASDGHGLTIDNVKIVGERNNQDIVVNGGFELPNFGRSETRAV